MSAVGQIERLTQDRVVELFQKQLGYDYLGNWEERENNSNIEEDILRKYLTERGYSQTLIGKAIHEFTRAATNQSKSLYDVNKDVYTMLRYGVKVKEDVGENTQTVMLIDWKNPEKNHFPIAQEVTIRGENKKRPDVVLYVNGIALAVLELKRSIISVSEGIRQNLDNQKQVFIRPFFAAIQLIMAGNDTEGVRYGSIETPEKYYLTWKEESAIENSLDRHIIQLCSKERFLELLHDFIVFDRGIKKQKLKFEAQERQSQRLFVSGESHYYKGRRYLLNVIYHNAASRVEIRKNKIDLYVREGSTSQQRENVLIEWYRKNLKEQIPALIEKWQKIIGVEVKDWGVKHMKTKWGTCTIAQRRIWLNLELAKKPQHCLEYIIAHEMVHLIERNHNDRFVAFMDKFMPQWHFYKEEPNRSMLSHEIWSY